MSSSAKVEAECWVVWLVVERGVRLKSGLHGRGLGSSSPLVQAVFFESLVVMSNRARICRLGLSHVVCYGSGPGLSRPGSKSRSCGRVSSWSGLRGPGSGGLWSTVRERWVVVKIGSRGLPSGVKAWPSRLIGTVERDSWPGVEGEVSVADRGWGEVSWVKGLAEG
ncbi:hypothetical protein HAX54_002253 [Datura stramonium]|uniref:Uncharacterized protein n=1 Tax=Datura stramonium TaxID=4076 RepID=A0ABS8T3L6_DATST|nr:hypothetical protein [Datura stramonium]